ncbi:hypothetical protein PG996_005931 [Apiospora saccharicola]|uniref:Uncharacterized protein n=1 Tax=Apiospora saccharicola TaxID=335842 RepID=A0ABR1VMU2_9PEZI
MRLPAYLAQSTLFTPFGPGRAGKEARLLHGTRVDVVGIETRTSFSTKPDQGLTAGASPYLNSITTGSPGHDVAPVVPRSITSADEITKTSTHPGASSWDYRHRDVTPAEEDVKRGGRRTKLKPVTG